MVAQPVDPQKSKEAAAEAQAKIAADAAAVAAEAAEKEAKDAEAAAAAQQKRDDENPGPQAFGTVQHWHTQPLSGGVYGGSKRFTAVGT